MRDRIQIGVRAGVLGTMLLVLTNTGATVVGAQCDDNHPGSGARYSKWTAQWWQWVYRLPVSENPLFDETGENAYNGQPNPAAFYLVGVVNESNTASRSICIRRGTPLFGPVINLQNDNVYNDVPLSIPELKEQARGVIDTAIFDFRVDGVSRPELVYRVKSPVFSYYLPDEDNIYQYFGTDITGWVRPSVSDGYWFYVPPLRKGAHVVEWTAMMDYFGTPFSLAIRYEITVR